MSLTDPERVNAHSDPRFGPTAPDHTIEMCTRWLLAACSLGAATLHFAYSPSHLAEYWLYGIFFVVLAWSQMFWAIGVVLRPWRWLLVAGIAGNVAVIAVWVLSRTVGVWVGPNATVSEAATYPDVLSTVLEAVIVVGATVVLIRPSVLGRRLHLRWATPVAVSTAMVLVAAFAGFGLSPRYAAAHDHSAHAGHSGHGQTVVVANGKTKVVTGHAAVAPAPYNPATNIDLSGVPGVTPAEQARAEHLVAITVSRLPQWADPATAVAAGYHSIGDGVTGTEHYINWSYINDDKILNPDYPESLVYRVHDGTKTLAAAMYMLRPGSTLDSVPDVGGPLTQWHIHDNLCFTADLQAPRVAGLTDASGNCRSPLVKLPPVPMIHVWIIPQACGPFAALEGVGGGQIKPGEQRLCDQVHSNTL
jgi:hypothetical protein